MKRIILGIIFWCFSFAAQTQEMVPIWAKQLGGPEWDIAKTLCVTPKGDIITTGIFSDSIIIADNVYYSNGSTDVFVARYKNDGEYTGAFTFGSEASDFTVSSAFDDHMILLTKFYRPFKIGGVKIDSVAITNYLVGWFDDSGKLLYSQILAGNDDLVINCLETDHKGTVYLTGWSDGPLKIGNEICQRENSKNSFIISLKKGGKQSPSIFWESERNVRLFASGIGNGNKFYVSGVKMDIEADANNSSIVYNELFIAGFDSTGQILNRQALLKGIDVQPIAIKESKKNVWLTVSFRHYCILGTDTIKAKGQNDILLLNISDKNEPRVHVIGGYANDLPLNLSISGQQVILSGSYSDLIWFDDKKYLISEKLGSDLFLAVFTDEETSVEAISFGGIYNDFPCAIATSDAGVYVMGQFKNTLTVGNTQLQTLGSYDVFVIRFENCKAKQQIEITAETLVDIEGNTNYSLSIPDNYHSCVWDDGLGYGSSIIAIKKERYSVHAVDEFGCPCSGTINLNTVKSAILTDDKLTGVQQVEFKLYPTITNDVVYWQPGHSYPATGAMLIVYDYGGRAVLTRRYNGDINPQDTQILRLGELVSGLYLIQLTGEGYNESVKVVVK
ncbi:hypothetical protein [Mariniphaga sediminis]|uniref:hypothetical protein n=1 Tax=Mariniphaga sediminis TaxID=1628158 RepID=UPI003566EC31